MARTKQPGKVHSVLRGLRESDRRCGGYFCCCIWARGGRGCGCCCCYFREEVRRKQKAMDGITCRIEISTKEDGLGNFLSI